MIPTQAARLAALTAMFAVPVLAQRLTVDKVGGAIGGQVSFPVKGEPNEPYLVLFDLTEQTTPIPALGITLDISDRYAGLCFGAPTFFGMTNANGDATAQVMFPNDPSLEPCVFSMQAIAGAGPFRVSNLARLTPQRSGTFKPALNSPSVPILGGGTAVAPNNELLFIGGSGPVAQRYLSRTEEWQLAGATFGVGLLSQTTGLADGRVLFTGGIDLTTGQPTNAAAIYDPTSGTTTMLTMASPRAGHGASLMGNGRVLITGGSSMLDLTNPLSLFTGILSSTEIFDPVTNTLSAGPTLLEGRTLHTSTTLTTGEVLIAGGISLLPIINIPNVSSTAYRFNPTTQSFGFPGFFSGARFLHSAAALDNGKVLLVGGLTLDLTTFLTTGNLADLTIGTQANGQVYTPGLFGSGSFASVPGLQVGRAGAAVAPLAGGGALVAGGFTLTIDISTGTFVFGLSDSADVFSQSPNAFTATGSMAAARLFPVATRLSDGTVIVVGGGAATAEIYQR